MYKAEYSDDELTATITQEGSTDPVITVATLNKREDEDPQDFKFSVEKVLRALNPKLFAVSLEIETDGTAADDWTVNDVDGSMKKALEDIGAFKIKKLEVDEIT